MKILFLGGVFSYDNNEEIRKNSKQLPNYAANEFQLKLIDGFKKNKSDICVISAPFIGSYPRKYNKIKFNSFKNDEFNSVSFINIWGIRNFFRTNSLKKKIKEKFKDNESVTIIIYSAHTPFLEAAIKMKKKNPDIKICLIVPDLPEYMNLESGRKLVYRFFKYFDIQKIKQCIKDVDSFVLLTEQMKNKIDIANKKSIIIEGIVYEENKMNLRETRDKDKRIVDVVYTGTLNKKFGIIDLVNSFKNINLSYIRLIICGDGDSRDYIVQASKEDKRIVYKGIVDIDESLEIQKSANILINPRSNKEEYTKYSFPSKTMEYLITGNPVIAYKLDGIPKEYDEYINYIEENIESTLKKVILNLDNDEIQYKAKLARSYILENKNNIKAAEKILNLINYNTCN